MVRAGSPQSSPPDRRRTVLTTSPTWAQASGQVRLGRIGSNINWASVNPAARAWSRSSRARVILPSRVAAGEGPGVQEQEHQVRPVSRGQGQNLPEFVSLQGAGVQDGRMYSPGRQAPGQDPGVGAVQDEAKIGDLLHRFHHEGHAVVALGRQEAGVDVDEVVLRPVQGAGPVPGGAGGPGP